jgi:energy-coupling factor transporter ATP-binding protein EcfA2
MESEKLSCSCGARVTSLLLVHAHAGACANSEAGPKGVGQDARSKREVTKRKRHPAWRLPGIGQPLLRCPNSGIHAFAMPGNSVSWGRAFRQHIPVLAKRNRLPADSLYAACRPQLTAAQRSRVKQRTILACTRCRCWLINHLYPFFALYRRYRDVCLGLLATVGQRQDRRHFRGNSMAILDEVRQWARGLTDWQREAVARLDENLILTAQDDEDLCAILKSSHAIPDPHGRVARPLEEQRRGIRDEQRIIVRLKAIKDIRNVNALAETAALTFETQGLTVIYGANGSGKSGYARVLKRSCSARDQRESVLPNADLPIGQVGIPQVTINAELGGREQVFTWINETPAPVELASVAVFDQRCAHAFIDNEGDFAYKPEGLDILASLGAACGRMRAKIQDELQRNVPNIDPLRELAQKKHTVAGRVAAAVPTKVSVAEVEAAAGLTHEQSARLKAVIKALSVPDPLKQAETFRNQSRRIEQLRRSIHNAAVLVGNDRVGELRGKVEASRQAGVAAKLAAEVFRNTPGQLPNTGSEEWRSLFEAARAFAATSVPIAHFPHLHSGDPCPLCQQALSDDAAVRLVGFEEFIQGHTQRMALEARAVATASYVAMRDAQLDIGLNQPLSEELTSINPAVATKCRSVEVDLLRRRDGVLAACGDQGDWSAVVQLDMSVLAELEAIATDIAAKVVDMEAATDGNARVKLEAEREELEAHKLFGQLKEVALSAIDRHDFQLKMNACLTDVTTHAITRKSTDLSENMAMAELVRIINEELNELNIAKVRVGMKPQGERGKTTYKLILERPGGRAAKDVLSEGEQQAVAIASFLTERRLSGTTSGVVFDDPVCSLDHVRRERVARRIAKEALERQVIVFTHDLFFLYVLAEAARSLGAVLAFRSLRKIQAGYGAVMNTLPFEGASTKDRVGLLKVAQVECQKINRQGDEDAYKLAVRHLYSRLRETWERAVEEVLFNEAVVRFRKGVESNRLRKVYVEDDDVRVVVQNMGKCSNYTGHDAAHLADIAMPTPEEALVDIEALDTWRKNVVARQPRNI